MKAFWTSLTGNPISLIGSAIATAAAILFFSFFGLQLFGAEMGPYSGILAFAVLPAALVLGLVLIPSGIWRQRRRQRAATKRGEAFPVIDLNKRPVRDIALAFMGLTVVNIAILSAGSYQAVHTMESVQFCGTACHSVMAPEYTTYKRSPHQNVKCVSCHIGPGADWFVKSKLSGSWQLVSVALNLYPRPIPTPVHNLRPARETCEQCHWPDKFVGDRLKVITHYGDDEANTEKKNVLLMKVGGVQGRETRGIHWHVGPDHRIEYQSDGTRLNIGVVKLIRSDGTEELFQPKAGGDAAKLSANGDWRVMDCIDCHNRPSHIYRMPQDEIDNAMASGEIDKTLPFIHREGLAALKASYPDEGAARQGIDQKLRTFYSSLSPALAPNKLAEVDRAVKALGTIWSNNVFPQMKVEWGTYPTHLGHENFPGCFRCHDDEHTTAQGKTISGDCTICHSLLAMEEENPEILSQLNP